MEHFTCSICPTLFGPHDSYYEHDGDVYCHYHYSTRFATKCAGCSTAILKQFVEINRNMRDECWHPECYMINKVGFSSLGPAWKISEPELREVLECQGRFEATDKRCHPRAERRTTVCGGRAERVRRYSQGETDSYGTTSIPNLDVSTRLFPPFQDSLTRPAISVLSAFEESSAACISDMLRQVSNGQYLDAIRMAEKFILHVEVLFGAIDDLEHHFASNGLKGTHTPSPRVDLFHGGTFLSNSSLVRYF